MTCCCNLSPVMINHDKNLISNSLMKFIVMLQPLERMSMILYWWFWFRYINLWFNHNIVKYLRKQNLQISLPVFLKIDVTMMLLFWLSLNWIKSNKCLLKSLVKACFDQYSYNVCSFCCFTTLYMNIHESNLST